MPMVQDEVDWWKYGVCEKEMMKFNTEFMTVCIWTVMTEGMLQRLREVICMSSSEKEK